jgi:hypothetical protein
VATAKVFFASILQLNLAKSSLDPRELNFCENIRTLSAGCKSLLLRASHRVKSFMWKRDTRHCQLTLKLKSKQVLDGRIMTSRRIHLLLGAALMNCKNSQTRSGRRKVDALEQIEKWPK